MTESVWNQTVCLHYNHIDSAQPYAAACMRPSCCFWWSYIPFAPLQPQAESASQNPGHGGEVQSFNSEVSLAVKVTSQPAARRLLPHLLFPVIPQSVFISPALLLIFTSPTRKQWESLSFLCAGANFQLRTWFCSTSGHGAAHGECTGHCEPGSTSQNKHSSDLCIVPFSKYFQANCTILKPPGDLGIRSCSSRNGAPRHGPAACSGKCCKETPCTKLLTVPALDPKHPAIDEGGALSSRCCFWLCTFIPVEGLWWFVGWCEQALQCKWKPVYLVCWLLLTLNSPPARRHCQDAVHVTRTSVRPWRPDTVWVRKLPCVSEKRCSSFTIEEIKDLTEKNQLMVLLSHFLYLYL